MVNKNTQEKNITLKDIAKALNLSVNAVSRALRDADDISKETKQKVQQMAQDMGYVPNSVAIALKKGSSNRVGIIFNDFYNPYFPLVCNKMFDQLEKSGYEGAIDFCKSPMLGIEHVKNSNLSRCCAVTTFVEPTPETALFFKKRNIPLILIGINPTSTNVDCVYTDDFLGGQLVGRHFIEGPRHKALYVSDSLSETSYRRFSGLSEAIRNNDLGKTLDLIPMGGEDSLIENAYSKIKNEHIDFVFCHSDSLAISLMSYLGKKKYGEKITVVGFDNLHKYSPLNLKITSVDYDMAGIIEYTLKSIISKVNGQTPIHNRIKKVFPVTLSIK